MPSLLHEVLVELFRTRKTLAPELLQNVFDVELPPYSTVELQEANLNQIVPTEYTADLVVLLLEGRPVYGIVVEAQLRPDEGKTFSWPLYAMALRAKLQCPTAVLVVTPSASVARWAAAPIETGQPGCTFEPLVLGPGAIPWVSDQSDASRTPELAVLSALAHGNEQGGLDVVLAAVAAAFALDDEHARLYYDQVMASLNEVVCREFEAMVQSGAYEYQSEFAKKYVAEGREEGRTEGREEGRTEGREEGREEGRTEGQAGLLRRLLARRFGELSSDTIKRLENGSPAELEQWADRILDAKSLADVFGT
jgi:hypothetical protein